MVSCCDFPVPGLDFLPGPLPFLLFLGAGGAIFLCLAGVGPDPEAAAAAEVDGAELPPGGGVTHNEVGKPVGKPLEEAANLLVGEGCKLWLPE